MIYFNKLAFTKKNADINPPSPAYKRDFDVKFNAWCGRGRKGSTSHLKLYKR